jgi:hypothetical protein
VSAYFKRMQIVPWGYHCHGSEMLCVATPSSQSRPILKCTLPSR